MTADIDIDTGDIYTHPGPGLCSTQLELGVGWCIVDVNLLGEPDFHQKFHIIIAANAASVCYAFRLNLCVPDST